MSSEAVSSGQWPTAEWSVVSGQWSVVSGQWSVFELKEHFHLLQYHRFPNSIVDTFNLRQTVVTITDSEVTMKLNNYQELIVWQRAMDLVEEVYAVSRSFPREEIYGLTSQLRRAAVSIPSNIAEGQGRRTTADFLRHLSIGYGSLLEVETQILIATRLDYLTLPRSRKVMNISAEVGRLFNGLISSLAK